jgi:hypothetical protein
MGRHVQRRSTRGRFGSGGFRAIDRPLREGSISLLPAVGRVDSRVKVDSGVRIERFGRPIAPRNSHQFYTKI